KAAGTVRYGPAPEEKKSKAFRRSLFVVRDIRKGEPFTEENVRSIRPASGLPPRHQPEVLGRCAACDIAPGTPLAWEMVEKPPAPKAERPAARPSPAERFEIVPLEPSGYADWDRFCRESDDAWFWHTSEWLQYTLDYRPELKPQSQSFALKSEGEIVAVCP